uniref:Uncharacterized protein n=1 Tax=Timema douglasi TaxID=61478 RepID=A0A7R8VSS3_TIMDO|nr:unnamed protein product [Timema douglasi]
MYLNYTVISQSGPGKLASPQHPATENDSTTENTTNNSRHSSVAAVRHHVVRPQSMYTGDNPNRPSPHARPLSVSTSPEQSRLLSELNRVILPTTSSPLLPSNIPTSKPDSITSLSSLSEADMLGSPASSPFVSYKQFLQLTDMVSKLEHKLDKQREEFTKTVNDLALKLSEEVEQRFHIQKELDKLSNLVTQV